MTEPEARRHAEALAQAMGITFYVVRSPEGDFFRCKSHRTISKSS
jgi:hypothetical protein